jgi:uncharacterized protein YjbJ (UPF0337 family)
MNKDRIEGSAEQAKGKVKEVAGKVTGDTKLESEGKAQKAAGKIQNTIGGMKDAVKAALDDCRLADHASKTETRRSRRVFRFPVLHLVGAHY